MKVKKNLRAISSAVNPKFLCNSKIGSSRFSCERGKDERREESLLERRCGDRASVARGESGESQQKFPQAKILRRSVSAQHLMRRSTTLRSSPRWEDEDICLYVACGWWLVHRVPGVVHSLSPFYARRRQSARSGFVSSYALVTDCGGAQRASRKSGSARLKSSPPHTGSRFTNIFACAGKRSNEQATGLNSGFFPALLEKDFLARYDPQRARLRTFLRVCVDHLIANEDKASRRLKRGGEVQFLSLDFESAEGELQQIEIPSPDSMENFFEREWVRSVFSLSLQRLRLECEERGKADALSSA